MFDMEASIAYTLREQNKDIARQLEILYMKEGGNVLYQHLQSFYAVDWGTKEPEKTLEVLIDIRKYVLNNISPQTGLNEFLQETYQVITRYRNYIADSRKGVKLLKRADMYRMPFIQVLDKMEMVDFKVHTDNSGTIQAVEVRYVSAQEKEK